MPNPVVHWEITARDAKKMEEFYANLFGWHVESDNPMNYGFVDTHTDTGINGGIPQAQEGDQPRVILYVEVDDLQAYLDRAEELGGRTLMPPTEIPGIVTIAMFADPEGQHDGVGPVGAAVVGRGPRTTHPHLNLSPQGGRGIGDRASSSRGKRVW